MKVIVTKDYGELSRKAFEIMRLIVSATPDAVLGLATGSTPMGMYDLMAEDYKKGGISYARVRSAPDEQKECDRYNALLKTLDRDIQILGIGSNGHIGFNEPGTPFDSETHVVNLTENTIKDNSRLFDSIDRVPKKAYSMGIKNILDAKKIVVMASGEHKAKAVYDMLNADISVACPATALRTHGDVTLIADEGAAQLLK